jgi:hypothetical protein
MSSTRPGPVTYGRNSRYLQKKIRRPLASDSELLPPGTSHNIGRAFSKAELEGLHNLEDLASSAPPAAMTADRPNVVEKLILCSQKLVINTSGIVLQTPFPAQSNDSNSEAYKLGTTKPIPDSPGHQFSPVPLGSSITNTQTLPSCDEKPVKRTRTTSRTLKENMRPKAS